MPISDVLVLFTILFFVSSVSAEKLRAWVGPRYFFEGQLPFPRTSHGLASSSGKIYLFGGNNFFGEGVVKRTQTQGMVIEAAEKFVCCILSAIKISR